MRWFGRLLIVLALVIAVLAPALWLGRDTIPPRVAQWIINRGLGADVIDALAFRVRRVGLDGLSLIDVRVNRGDPLMIERLDVAYDWRALLAGRVDDIGLIGPTLTVRVDTDGAVSFGGLDKVREALLNRNSATVAANTPPVPRVRLVGTHIAIAGVVDGTVRLSGPITLNPDGVGAALDIDADMRRPSGDRLTVSGRAVMDTEADTRRVVVTLDTGEATLGRLSLAGLRGTASLGQSSQGVMSALIDLRAREARAAGVELPLPAVFARLDPLGVSGVARLGSEAAPEARLAVTIDSQNRDGRHRVRVEGTVDLARLDAVLAAVADRAPIGVLGSVGLRVGGAVPAKPDDGKPNEPETDWISALWRATTASGVVDLRLDALPLPGVAGLEAAGSDSSWLGPAGGVVKGSGRLAVAMAAGRLAIETAAPFQLDTDIVEAPDTLDRLLGDGPLIVTLGAETRPLSLLLTPGDGVPRVIVTGSVAARAVSGAAMSADGEMVAMSTPQGWQLGDGTELAMTVSDVAFEPFQIDRTLLTVTDLNVTEDATSAAWALAVDGSAANVGPEPSVIGAKAIALSLTGRATGNADRFTLALSELGQLRLTHVTTSDALDPIETIKVGLGGDRRPILTVPANATPMTVRVPLSLSALRLANKEQAWAVMIDPTQATIEASLDRAGRGTARLRLRDGRAIVADTGVALDGLAADLRLAIAAGGVSLSGLDLSAARLSDRRRLPWFVPLSLDVSARPVAHGEVGVSATARGADGALVIDVEGRLMPARGTVLASFEVFPIEFIPGGLQPADLAPAASALFRDTSGRISIDGTIGWPAARMPVDDPLTVSIADLSFTGSLGTVSGLSGDVTLTGVDPIQTASGQVLAATAIDLGVPIAQPLVRFQVTDGNTLEFQRIEALFADGTIGAEDVSIPLAVNEAVAVTLDVADVNATRLAEVVDLSGLEASGTLSGRFPVVWDPREGVSVRGARLVSDGGGTVRYAPEAPPAALRDAGPKVSLMLQVIRNLVYERLELEADGKPGEPFDVKLRVRGANPDFYDGHPVALNVTLTGRLDELFRNARRSLGLGDALRRQIQTEALGG